MTILATYKAHVTPKYDTVLPFRMVVACICALVFVAGSVVVTYFNYRIEVLLLYLSSLCFVINAAVYIDMYMKWHCAEETVSVQHEMLVIERRKCLFGRRKEIPLSAIKNVETYDDGSGSYECHYDKLGNVTDETRTIALPQHGEVYQFRMLYRE